MTGAWQGSTRRARLPRNWEAIRRRVIARDGAQCTELLSGGLRCIARGTDVDHIVRGDDHSLANLALLCRTHHLAKTQREATEAKRARAAAARYTPQQTRHPGLIADD